MVGSTRRQVAIPTPVAIPIQEAIFRCGLMSPITTAITMAVAAPYVITEIPATKGSQEGTISALTTHRHSATLIRSLNPRACRCLALRSSGSRCSGGCSYQGDKNVGEAEPLSASAVGGRRNAGRTGADSRSFPFELNGKLDAGLA